MNGLMCRPIICCLITRRVRKFEVLMASGWIFLPQNHRLTCPRPFGPSSPVALNAPTATTRNLWMLLPSVAALLDEG